ncbi:MAG TPA: hypothetical protein VIF62_28660 [Labilithrix sp.]
MQFRVLALGLVLVACDDGTAVNPVPVPAPAPTQATFGADASASEPATAQNTEDPIATSCYVASWVCATEDAGIASCETQDAAATCHAVNSGQVSVVCCDP